MQSQSIYLILAKVSLLFTVVAFLFYFLTRKKQGPGMIFLGIMLFASVLSDFLGIYVAPYWEPIKHPKAGNVLGNLYTIVEIITVVLLYQVQLAYQNKRPIQVLLAILLVAQFYAMIVSPGIWEFPSLSRSMLAIGVTVLALSYFFKLLKELPVIQIHRLPMFWITIGFLVTFTGNFFLYLVRDYLVDVLKDRLFLYWSFHNFLAALGNILFSIGLWQATRVEEQRIKPENSPTNQSASRH